MANANAIAINYASIVEIRKALAIIASAEAMMKESVKLIEGLEKGVKALTPNEVGEFSLSVNGESLGKVVVGESLLIDQKKLLEDFPDMKLSYGKISFRKSVKLT